MWIGQVSWERLVREGRWSVELFASLNAPRLGSTFPKVPIEKLVSERRETLVPSRWPEFSFAYVGLQNVSSQTGMLEAFTTKLGSEIQSTSGVFRPGDVLYGRLRPYLNKVYLADGYADTGICSGEFFVLTPRLTLVRPLFLRELLASAYVADAVKGMQFGSTLPRLQLKDLLMLEVPLPPLGVQEELESHLRGLRETLSKSLEWTKSAGRGIRTAFEVSLRDGTPLTYDDETRESVHAPLLGLPPDYSVSVRRRRADLRRADLAGAELEEANLTGADLEGAKLEGADLSEAVLADAKGLS